MGRHARANKIDPVKSPIPGDTVAVLMENKPELLMINWAAWAFGLKTVPLDIKRDTPERKRYKLELSRSKVLFVRTDQINGDTVTTDNILTNNPLFAVEYSDVHLKSETGRWTAPSTWAKDDVHSPCIDAGDPTSDHSNEPQPNGRQINIGAYGNTEQASKSPPPAGTVIVLR